MPFDPRRFPQKTFSGETKARKKRVSSADLLLFVPFVSFAVQEIDRVFVINLTAKCAKIAKSFMVCFSMFVFFVFFAVHVFNRL